MQMCSNLDSFLQRQQTIVSEGGRGEGDGGERKREKRVIGGFLYRCMGIIK